MNRFFQISGFIAPILCVVLFFACEKGQIPEENLTTDKRIHSVTTFSNPQDTGSLYEYLYDPMGQLTEVRHEGSPLAILHYEDRKLILYESFVGPNVGEYSISYADLYVLNVERFLFLPEDLQEQGIRFNEHEIYYDFEDDFQFTVRHRHVDHQVTPPHHSFSIAHVSQDKQFTTGYYLLENDTLQSFQTEVRIEYNDAIPNPLLHWNLPAVFNPLPLLPFCLSYPISVSDIFYQSPYLPHRITRKRLDVNLNVEAEYKYVRSENLLSEIQCTLKENGVIISEGRAVIEWR